jgi:streptomycin 6-kinase
MQSIPVDIIKKWALTHYAPVEHSGINVVFTAQKNDTTLIVKIIKDTRAFNHELLALEYYQDNGVVTLFDKDIKHHALLLEKVHPGTTLKSYFPQGDAQAVQIAATLMQRLHGITKHSIPLSSFKTLAEIISSLNVAPKRELPSTLLIKAKKFSESLLKEKYSVVLHGDLHHDNILLSDKHGWIAIDPKGLIGDPVYEAATFMCNPMPTLLTQDKITIILQQRLKLFSQLMQWDPQRLFEWTYVRAALGACWAIEDEQDADYFIGIAEILKSI